MSKFINVDAVSESAMIVGLPPTNRVVGGRLRFDPGDGISLQLLDLGDIERIVLGARAHYPAMIGQLVHGPRVTLLDCTTANTNFGIAGIADVQIVANQLLVGMHLPDPTIKPFDEIRVALTGLNEWFGVSTIRLELEELSPPEIGRQATITCKHLPRFGFSPTSGGPSLGSEQIINPSSDLQNRGVIENHFELCLRPRAPFGLEECVFELFRLQAFMSILTGHQMYYQQVRLYLYGFEKTARQINAVTYMSRFARPENEPKKYHTIQMLLPLPLIQDSLPSIWSTWTERYEQYRSAVELFTSTELFGGQLLNFQLLAIMQSLETFHRNRFGGTYADEADYALIANTLTGAIPAATGGDLRSALKAKLKYGNEYSLRKRLRKLADGLPGGAGGSVGALIHPSLREFLSKSVDTRNYLTHYTVELESEAFRDADLYWATRLLRWFFVAVLLHDMGLPERQLVDAFTRAEDLTHARQSMMKTNSSPSIGTKVETAEKAGVESSGMEPTPTDASSAPEIESAPRSVLTPIAEHAPPEAPAANGKDDGTTSLRS